MSRLVFLALLLGPASQGCATDDGGSVPTDPIEPAEPTEPGEPTDPTEPPGPMEPMEPMEPGEPLEPAAALGPPSFGLNDVSVLLPLPASAADTRVLRFDTAGNGGALLPTDLFDHIPVVSQTEANERAYGRWRIVAARIDPCFPDLALLSTNPSACHRQLRLVAQPLDPASATVAFGDDAIHLFFDLTPSEFAEMSARWLGMSANAPVDQTRALEVHPAQAAQGLSGEVARQLRSIVRSYAGPARLSRVAFMVGQFAQWDMGAFDVVNGALSPRQVSGAEPMVFGQIVQAGTFGIFTFFTPTAATDILQVLSGSTIKFGQPTVELTASASEVRGALQLAANIENPRTAFHGDSIDCASCHMATRARLRAATIGASLAGIAQFEDDAFDLSLALPPGVASDPTQQRALGYKGAQPVWNQRTVNESAVIAAYLHSLAD